MISLIREKTGLINGVKTVWHDRIIGSHPDQQLTQNSNAPQGFISRWKLEQPKGKQTLCKLGVHKIRLHVCFSKRTWLSQYRTSSIRLGVRKAPLLKLHKPTNPLLFEIWCNQSFCAFLLHLTLRIWVIASYCLWTLLRVSKVSCSGGQRVSAQWG